MITQYSYDMIKKSLRGIDLELAKQKSWSNAEPHVEHALEEYKVQLEGVLNNNNTLWEHPK